MKAPIAVIDCATHEPSHECFNQLIQNFNIPFTYHATSQTGTSSLCSIERPSGYIIFGSDSNVCDRLPWQVDLAKLMKEKILEGIPVLGICFGHQLMADAFGGRVDLITKSNKCFEGTRKQEVLNEMHGFMKSEFLNLFVTHHYEVKKMPKDFIHLSTSKECFYDGLAHKTLPYFSFQGHPEASKHFVKEHIEIELTPAETNSAFKDSLTIMSNFVNLVQRTS